jgi:hypothetical protein
MADKPWSRTALRDERHPPQPVEPKPEEQPPVVSQEARG